MSHPLGQVMSGCVVLVTADRRSGELGSALSRRGATVRHAPALSIVPHEHDEQLLLDTKDLLAAAPDTVVVTTGIGFRGWVEAADAAGLADELVEVLRGAPSDVLLARAREAALLVVGSRGHGTVRPALLGSVALHCVMHATCPVLVVHPEHRVAPEAALSRSGPV